MITFMTVIYFRESFYFFGFPHYLNESLYFKRTDFLGMLWQQMFWNKIYDWVREAKNAAFKARILPGVKPLKPGLCLLGWNWVSRECVSCVSKGNIVFFCYQNHFSEARIVYLKQILHLWVKICIVKVKFVFWWL